MTATAATAAMTTTTMATNVYFDCYYEMEFVFLSLVVLLSHLQCTNNVTCIHACSSVHSVVYLRRVRLKTRGERKCPFFCCWQRAIAKQNKSERKRVTRARALTFGAADRACDDENTVVYFAKSVNNIFVIRPFPWNNFVWKIMSTSVDRCPGPRRVACFWMSQWKSTHRNFRLCEKYGNIRRLSFVALPSLCRCHCCRRRPHRRRITDCIYSPNTQSYTRRHLHSAHCTPALDSSLIRRRHMRTSQADYYQRLWLVIVTQTSTTHEQRNILQNFVFYRSRHLSGGVAFHFSAHRLSFISLLLFWRRRRHVWHAVWIRSRQIKQAMDRQWSLVWRVIGREIVSRMSVHIKAECTSFSFWHFTRLN